jgi:predicted nucleotidyltransferase
MATQRSTPQAELIAFCEQLRRAHIRPERLLLFGSWARGKQREESDIDLIVVSRDFARFGDLRRLETLGIAAGRALVSVQAFGYTPEEFAAPEPTSFLAMVLAQKTVELPVPRIKRRNGKQLSGAGARVSQKQPLSEARTTSAG